MGKSQAAARVDKLKTAVQALSNGNVTEHLREELKHVWSSLPRVEQMKQLFAHQWANVSKIADMEDLHSSLLEMKPDSAEANELRQQLQDWPEPVTNVTIADMQHQVANMWDELQGKGFSFPNFDNFNAHVGDVVKKLARSVQNSTMVPVHGLIEEIKAGASHGVPQ
jgi:DNA repair ATPase RecN